MRYLSIAFIFAFSTLVMGAEKKIAVKFEPDDNSPKSVSFHVDSTKFENFKIYGERGVETARSTFKAVEEEDGTIIITAVSTKEASGLCIRRIPMSRIEATFVPEDGDGPDDIDPARVEELESGRKLIVNIHPSAGSHKGGTLKIKIRPPQK